MLLEERTTTRSAFEEGTGWALKPEGACKADVCIPLGPAGPQPDQQEIDALALAEAIGLPVAEAASGNLWALGPEAIGQRALLSADAPDFTLPDLDGNPFKLSSLKGQKIVVYAWAPY